MDTHQEILEFINAHAAAFSGIRDISSATNAFHSNPSRWEREKEWALNKERQSSKREADRQAPRSLSHTAQQVTETARRMKAMHASGCSQ